MKDSQFVDRFCLKTVQYSLYLYEIQQFTSMITTRIQVPEHLREYMSAKCECDEGKAIRIPDKLDLYHYIYDLLEKRPADHPIDKGNLEIILPERSVGKRPESYNYLGIRSQRIIAKKIETMMWSEVHDLLDAMKHREGIEYKDAVHLFICKYRIESLTEDAFLKNYYRWRGIVRRREKRKYSRK